jgi:hypothetical protein
MNYALFVYDYPRPTATTSGFDGVAGEPTDPPDLAPDRRGQ